MRLMRSAPSSMLNSTEVGVRTRNLDIQDVSRIAISQPPSIHFSMNEQEEDSVNDTDIDDEDDGINKDGELEFHTTDFDNPDMEFTMRPQLLTLNRSSLNVTSRSVLNMIRYIIPL